MNSDLPHSEIAWSRRGFLARAGGVTAALATAATGLPTQAVEPLTRPGKPRWRLSVAAYSFRDFFNAKDAAQKLSLKRFIDFCADQGCDGVELTGYYFPKDLQAEHLLEVKRHAFLRGLDISGTAVGNNFARPEGPEWTTEIAAVKRWIDHAALMGAPHIRVFAGDPKGLSKPEAQRQCVRALEDCAAYAATRGVWLGLENHGGIVAEVADLLQIVQAVKNPWVGVNLDTGNFYGEADPYEDMARLAPYAVNVQVKVEVSRRGKGKEATDLTKVRELLHAANYQGYVVLEYEAAPDPWTAVPDWLHRMREVFG